MGEYLSLMFDLFLLSLVSLLALDGWWPFFCILARLDVSAALFMKFNCCCSVFRVVLYAALPSSLATMWTSRLRYCRQYSSSYLPVAPPSSPPASSRDSSRDNSSRQSKDSKSRQIEASNIKRRSTMNSRDAAYDEEEQLRRAIEESKEENKSTTDEVATRRGKRSRSDSEA